MSKVEMMRALVEQRLTAAALEIFGLFERTIAEYEEELRRSKEEHERQQTLLDAVWKRGVRVHRTDIRQLLVIQDEVSHEQRECSPSLDQEDPPEPPHITKDQEDPPEPPRIKEEQEDPPEPPHIKEDQEELFTRVTVKSVDAEEKPQSSQLHQRHTERMETGADGEDCGGPQPARNSHPGTHLQPENEDQPEDSAVNQDNQEITESHLDLTIVRNNEVSCSDGVRRNNDEAPFSCSLCGERFKQKRHLTQHMLVHTGERHFSCSVCGKKFHLKSILRGHMAVHTVEKIFSCSICSKSFNRNSNLTKHMAVHTGGKQFSCSVCCKRFTQKQNLKRHVAIHTGERNFMCSVCGKRFNRNSNLRAHMAVHTGKKTFLCSLCDQTFSLDKQLQRHECTGLRSVQLHQNQSEQSREAELRASSSTEQMETGADGEEDCGETPPARNSHPEPEEQTRDSQEITESNSGLTFQKNNDLSDETPFSCSVCGKRYSARGSLRRHMGLHTGERNFSCSVCGKSFTKKDNLTRHMVVHTGERKFSCPVCCRNFKRKSTLKGHMAVHAEEKRLSCSICSRRFNRNTHLRAHMAAHTGKKSFRCSLCDQTFDLERQLERHTCAGLRSAQLHQKNQTERNRGAELRASSSTERMDAGADGEEDRGGTQPARNSHPETHLLSENDTSDTEDSGDY